MRAYELLTESKQIALAKKAYASLSDDARAAIDSWEAMNWIGGPLEQHIKANDEIAQEIERAFKPVRDSIPGQTIRLYRGYVPDDAWNNWKDKHLESWTSDRRVAEHFAGLRQVNNKSLLHKVPSMDDIGNAVSQYDRTGYVKFRGKYYVRSKTDPKYYNIYDRNRQFVTDGDDLRADLVGDAEWLQKLNTERLSKGKLIEKDINKNDIIWLTNNLGSKEFIVKVNRGEVSETTIKLRGFGPSEKTKEWVAKVNDMFPQSPISPSNRLMTFGEGNDMSIVQFELTPKEKNKVELKWIQATPMRTGAGSKAIKILQDLAQADGIALTLFPWDKGVVSQSKLMKFYKKQGFSPIGKSKNMIWSPESGNES